MKARTSIGALAVAAVATACGANVTVEASSLCVRWQDGGAPAAGGAPAGVACENIPGIGVLGNGKPPAVEYVCIEPGEAGCPSPADAHARFAGCVDARTGPSCQTNPDGTFTQGTCVVRATVSACGPDPAAKGACCYWAYIVEFEFTT